MVREYVQQSLSESGTSIRTARALGLAHYWQRLLDAGKYRSLTEIAAVEGIALSQASRTSQLTRLAPHIIESCLPDGRDRPKLEQLARACVSANWTDQPLVLTSETQDQRRHES